MDIGKVITGNKLVLAPMAGITDYPFRSICKQHECGLLFSEMVSARGLLNGPEEYLRSYLYIGGDDRPLSVQLFGSDPDTISRGAVVARNAGADIIDINMGCSVPKILKNRAGAWLMRDTDLASRVMERTVKKVDVPVTVKFRRGWEALNIDAAVDIAAAAEKVGVAAVSVHGRTVEQRFSGEADWGIIKKIKTRVSIPVIGNGDVCSPGDAVNMLNYTGCEGVMIGRAARGNPWIFSRTQSVLQGREKVEPSAEEKIYKLLHHLKLLVEFKGEITGVKEMRRHAKWYLKGIRNANRVKQNLNRINNREEFKSEVLSLLHQV